MDFDTVVSQPRWKILEALARSPSSPVELSKTIGTSVAYVSQQLKVLEIAGFIKKERTGAAEKGKARTIFSVAQDLLHLTAILADNPQKKMIKLTDYHERVLRIWLLDDIKLHYYIEKFYWMVENEISLIDAILYDSTSQKILVVSDSPKIKSKVSIFKNSSNETIPIYNISQNEMRKYSQNNLQVIFDKKSIKNLKGGEQIVKNK